MTIKRKRFKRLDALPVVVKSWDEIMDLPRSKAQSNDCTPLYIFDVRQRRI